MDRLYSKNNWLLAKDSVGKAKPCTVQLPQKDHVYGKKLQREVHGVAVVTSSWETHKRSVEERTRMDFTKINKITSESIDYKVSPPK